MKADLFVGVHVNSFKGLENISGVETHFLDKKLFFGNRSFSKFLFASNLCGKDKNLVKVAEGLIKENIDYSKSLSNYLQQGVIDVMKNKNLDVVNRGTKKTGYRALVRSEVPAAIVEVGFMTNKKELQRLARGPYRKNISDGICSGIKNFINSFGKSLM